MNEKTVASFFEIFPTIVLTSFITLLVLAVIAVVYFYKKSPPAKAADTQKLQKDDGGGSGMPHIPRGVGNDYSYIPGSSSRYN